MKYWNISKISNLYSKDKSNIINFKLCANKSFPYINELSNWSMSFANLLESFLISNLKVHTER